MVTIDNGSVADAWYELVTDRGEFKLYLAERVIPYVRMTQASKWHDSRAQDYLARQDAIRGMVREIMRTHDIDPFPPEAKLALGCTFFGKYRGDLSNMEKAVEDALQGVLYENDRQIRRRLAGGVFVDNGLEAAESKAPVVGFEVEAVLL